MLDKRIGIMTMHRIVNYGSFLQAYALRKTIEELGYIDVEFVDYEFERDIIGPNKENGIIKKILRIGNPYWFVKRTRHRIKFEKKYKQYLVDLGVSEKKYGSNINTLVIGSDEVFNCLQHYPVGYSRNLFGKGYEDIKVISYAASFGHTTLPQLAEYGIADEVGDMLSKFKAISVRDKNSLNIVNTLVPNRKVCVNFDPVLVGNFDEILNDNNTVKYTNYIIVYAYPGRISKEEEKTIKEFARKHNKKIISLGFFQKCADINLVVAPLELLAYFKKADFVITDTFHGTVFSIKMNTNFGTLIRDSNKNKLLSLLKQVRCEKQILNSISDIERVYVDKADFCDCNKIIEKEAKRTKKYLMENL